MGLGQPRAFADYTFPFQSSVPAYSLRGQQGIIDFLENFIWQGKQHCVMISLYIFCPYPTMPPVWHKTFWVITIAMATPRNWKKIDSEKVEDYIYFTSQAMERLSGKRIGERMKAKTAGILKHLNFEEGARSHKICHNFFCSDAMSHSTTLNSITSLGTTVHPHHS